MVTIHPETLRALQSHGEAAYPNEGAGLLLGREVDGGKAVVDILPLENRWGADEQTHRYLITPQDMLAGENEAARRGLDVIGVFHSHPDHPAQPSGFDCDWALPWYSYVITSVEKGRAVVSRAWRLKEDRSGFDEEEIRNLARSGDFSRSFGRTTDAQAVTTNFGSAETDKVTRGK
jgi:proteasome lid subunit RPN8/RPN11